MQEPTLKWYLQYEAERGECLMASEWPLCKKACRHMHAYVWMVGTEGTTTWIRLTADGYLQV